MDYVDLYKKRSTLHGKNYIDRLTYETEREINRDFKQAFNYYSGSITKNDLSKKDVEVHMETNRTSDKKCYFSFRPHEDVRNGDMIEITAKNGKTQKWLVEKTYYNELTPKADMLLCFKTLNYKGLEELIYTWDDNSSYGVKGENDTTYLKEVDGKVQFKMQDNKYTRRIQNGWRFMLDNDIHEVYVVVDSGTPTNDGVRRIVMNKTDSCDKDDPINNIAYNECLEDKIVNPPTEDSGIHIVSSTGDMSCRRDCSVTFTIMNGTSISNGWDITVDYGTTNPKSIKIVKQTDSLITIKNLNNISASINIKFSKGGTIKTQTIKLVR